MKKKNERKNIKLIQRNIQGHYSEKTGMTSKEKTDQVIVNNELVKKWDERS